MDFGAKSFNFHGFQFKLCEFHDPSDKMFVYFSKSLNFPKNQRFGRLTELINIIESSS